MPTVMLLQFRPRPALPWAHPTLCPSLSTLRASTRYTPTASSFELTPCHSFLALHPAPLPHLTSTSCLTPSPLSPCRSPSPASPCVGRFALHLLPQPLLPRLASSLRHARPHPSSCYLADSPRRTTLRPRFSSALVKPARLATSLLARQSYTSPRSYSAMHSVRPRSSIAPRASLLSPHLAGASHVVSPCASFSRATLAPASPCPACGLAPRTTTDRTLASLLILSFFASCRPPLPLLSSPFFLFLLLISSSFSPACSPVLSLFPFFCSAPRVPSSFFSPASHLTHATPHLPAEPTSPLSPNFDFLTLFQILNFFSSFF